MKKLLCILLLLLAGSAGAGEYFFQNTTADVDGGPIDDAMCQGYDYYMHRNGGAYVYAFLRQTSTYQYRWLMLRIDSLKTLLEADAGASGLTIDTATLYVYCWSVTANSAIEVHRCLKPWAEGTKVWTTATEGEVTGKDWYYSATPANEQFWDCDTIANGYRDIYSCLGGTDDLLNTCGNGYAECAAGDSCYDFDSTMLAVDTFTTTSAQWGSFDLTSYVQDRYDDNSEMNLILLEARGFGSSTYQYIYTSNWSNQAYRPYLRVVYSSGGPAPEPTGNVKGVTLQGVTLDSP